MRLDEERLEELRSWGERLRRAGGEESAAVGRAILMLVEEIDRLHIELWHARIQPSVEEPSAIVETAVDEEEPVGSSLHRRLRRMLRRDETVEPVEQPESDAEREGTTSAQAWIAGMRDHK
jgi:hypothetical protein